MPTNLLLNFSAVSESIEPISELYGFKLRELGCFKIWPKIFFINKYVLISTAVIESIEQILELYGLN